MRERWTSAAEDHHLGEEELFALAVPPAGVPEALPRHLSECLHCSRALAEWKSAVRDLGEEDEDASTEEWRALEDATLAAVSRQRAPGRGRSRILAWALPAAATAILLCAVLLTGRNGSGRIVDRSEDSSGFSAQDRADDALLRDVDRLASGEETPGGWGALAPDPSGDAAAAPEGRS
ncbi:MAG: hypothetical protein DMF54_10825 [Acidobacteria bacterium]|nr:MAG: hypothetical protein DMF54_10825 [Acidobacteriota bacterium]